MARDWAKRYWPEETYGSAFGKLLTRLFAKQGLIFIEPLDPRLHAVAAPLFRKVVEQRDEVIAGLLKREKELEASGYEAQVKVTAKSTLLFRINGAGREAIAESNGTFKTSTETWSKDDLLRVVESEPHTFSPNALLRPVVQDYLFPTAALL